MERSQDGSWRIGKDYLDRAADLDRQRSGAVSVKVASWRALEENIDARAVTWLDDVELETLSATGFGGEARAAQARRLQWLRQQGLLADGDIRMSATARAQLDTDEVLSIGGGEARRTGRRFQQLAFGQSFDGVFERTIDGAARRFAVIGAPNAIVLAPWRREFEAQRGQMISVTANRSRVSWSIGAGMGKAIEP